MGKKSKGRCKVEVDADESSERATQVSLAISDEEDVSETPKDVLNDYLEALQDKKVKNKDHFVGQLLRLLQHNFIGELATSYVADVISKLTKKQSLDSIVKILALLFLQNPDEIYLEYLQKIDTGASLRARLLLRYCLDDPPKEELPLLLLKLQQTASTAEQQHVVESLALILANGGASLLSDEQIDTLTYTLEQLVGSGDSSLRHSAAKVSACLSVDELDGDSDEFASADQESLRSSMTTLSIEHAVEKNIRPIGRSVKKVHKRDRGLDKQQQQYLDMMRGESYQAKVVTMQFGKVVGKYKVESLVDQVVDETLRWVLEGGITVHVQHNIVVQNILGVEFVQPAITAEVRQSQKRERRKNIHGSRAQKSSLYDLDY